MQVLDHFLPMQEIQETQVGFLGRGDHLEEAMATHSSILAWEVPWAEGLQSMESQMNQTDRAIKQQQTNLEGFISALQLLCQKQRTMSKVH